jgi:predicted phosphodiesterase
MSTRLAILTDAHANLPALSAALAAITRQGCDAVFHLGDSIAIGPQPAECVALLLSTPGARCLMGNHESYLVDGLPQPRPDWMSEGEVEHQMWTHGQIDAAQRRAIAGWPYAVHAELDGMRAVLAHYALDATGRDFQPSVRAPAATDLDRLFAEVDADIVFYGHDHRAGERLGRVRYVSPGSLGCYQEPLARYCLATFGRGQCDVEMRAVPYDDEPLFRAFEERRVPERAFLYRAFFGGRFPR